MPCVGGGWLRGKKQEGLTPSTQLYMRLHSEKHTGSRNARARAHVGMCALTSVCNGTPLRGHADRTRRRCPTMLPPVAHARGASHVHRNYRHMWTGLSGNEFFTSYRALGCVTVDPGPQCHLLRRSPGVAAAPVAAVRMPPLLRIVRMPPLLRLEHLFQVVQVEPTASAAPARAEPRSTARTRRRSVRAGRTRRTCCCFVRVKRLGGGGGKTQSQII